MPTVANVWPEVTFCPTFTSTAVTWPDTANDSWACDAGSMVPDADTVCLMVPVPTVTFWVVTAKGAADAGDELLRVSCQVISTAATTRTTTTPRASRRRRVHPRLHDGLRPSSLASTWAVGGAASETG